MLEQFSLREVLIGMREAEMTKNTHMCANPCTKGKAGGCSGACAIDFLDPETEARTGRARDDKNMPSDPGKHEGAVRGSHQV